MTECPTPRPLAPGQVIAPGLDLAQLSVDSFVLASDSNRQACNPLDRRQVFGPHLQCRLVRRDRVVNAPGLFEAKG